jgi:hypothetical protein
MIKLIGVRLERDYLAVLAAKRMEPQIQTTTLWGDSLLFSNFGANQQEHFKNLLSQWAGQPMTWGELAEIPRSPYMAGLRRLPLEDPLPPVKEAKLVLDAADWDPLRGYWMRFRLYPSAFPFKLI